MAGSTVDLLETILRECARTAPAPLYPAEFVQATGIPRQLLDIVLDQLRLGGLLRLTEWVQGRGQGYTVTEDGLQVLQDPRLMASLRNGGVAPRPATPPLGPVERSADFSPWERGEAIRDALVNETRPNVTFTLIFLNVVWFLVGLAYAQSQQIPLNAFLTASRQDPQAAVKVILVQEKLGSLHRSHLADHLEWWRLLSYAFIHYGLLHLFFNMWFLYSMGPMIERIWGPLPYLGLYLTAALGGGLASAFWSSGFVGGASGALCGLLGAFVVWVLVNRPYLPPALASNWLKNLMINVLLIVMVSMMPQVSAAGHFGGGAAGAVITLPFVWFRYHRGGKRVLGLLGLIAVPAAILAAVPMAVDEKERRAHFGRRFGGMLDDCRATATSTHDKHVTPLLKRSTVDLTALFADLAAVEEAKKALAQTEEKLKGCLEHLDEVGSSSHPKIQQMIDVAREYFQAWIDFDRLVLTILKRETTWDQAQQRRVLEKLSAINNLTERWNKAVEEMTAGLR